MGQSNGVMKQHRTGATNTFTFITITDSENASVYQKFFKLVQQIMMRNN